MYQTIVVRNTHFQTFVREKKIESPSPLFERNKRNKMKLRWNFAQRNYSRIIVNRYYEFLPQIQNSTYVRSLTNRPIFRIFSCHRAPRESRRYLVFTDVEREDKEAKEEKGGAGDRNRNDDCTIASNSTRERCKAVIVVDRRLIHLYIYI